MSETQSIVVENGSGVIKAGFSGDNQPRVKFPSIVGVPRSDKAMVGVESKSEYIGDEAQKMRGVLKLSYPIKSGIVTEWDLMERFGSTASTTSLELIHPNTRSCSLKLH